MQEYLSLKEYNITGNKYIAWTGIRKFDPKNSVRFLVLSARRLPGFCQAWVYLN